MDLSTGDRILVTIGKHQAVWGDAEKWISQARKQ